MINRHLHDEQHPLNVALPLLLLLWRVEFGVTAAPPAPAVASRRARVSGRSRSAVVSRPALQNGPVVAGWTLDRLRVGPCPSNRTRLTLRSLWTGGPNCCRRVH